MASDLSLVDFANRPRKGRAWVDDLPDDVFNQIWDALEAPTGVGPGVAAKWLQSLGYSGATCDRVKKVVDRERRP